MVRVGGCACLRLSVRVCAFGCNVFVDVVCVFCAMMYNVFVCFFVFAC